MNRFQELSHAFLAYFNIKHFPDQPSGLYDAASYMLGVGGKRIRPVLCLMGNELFTDIQPDSWKIATAIELFHNFTLIHDDIMDKAPLRRGNPTVHAKYNESSALLAGDVMLLRAYEYLNATDARIVQSQIGLLNQTGRQVCEGQQLDMDFESSESVSLSDYLHMIELKTAVFLAASLQMGAMVAGADESDQTHLYAFGKNLGLAFQVQDDWLDAFGDPEKFGKQTGGDIILNKKTFLLVQALETANAQQKGNILQVLDYSGPDKVKKMLVLFNACGVDRAAQIAQQKYMEQAATHLDSIRVPSERKIPLRELAAYLLQRNF
jgi:geranylgeranyl diphosphate synthase type II